MLIHQKISNSMEKLIILLSALALTFAVGFIMGSEGTERKYNNNKKP